MLQEIKDELVEKYRRLKSDPRYIDSRQRLDQLHSKLERIKRLVAQYDEQHQTNNNYLSDDAVVPSDAMLS